MKEIALKSFFRSLTLKRLLNAMRAYAGYYVSVFLRRSIVWGSPVVLTVEPSSRCNLRCPQCAVGSGKLTRKTGLLDIDKYKKIMDELGDGLIYLLLFNQGEPFMHPRLIEMIRIAKRKRIYVSVSTNGHFVDDIKLVEELVESGCDMIIISLDAADERTYARYRVGGNFQRVINGIKSIIEMKRSTGSAAPEIALQFLVMRQNQHQIPDFKKLARSLGVSRVLLKSVQVEDFRAAQIFLPDDEAFRRYSLANNQLRLKANPGSGCPRLWSSSVMLSDGSIVPCCFDKDAHFRFGTISPDSPFIPIWHSQQYHRFRTTILRRRQSIEICHNCTRGIKIYH
ncbi:radical SAM protein [candidate division KSB1 bacterium]|nr:radical SAM protein [candidate division KSB1 bacterium]